MTSRAVVKVEQNPDEIVERKILATEIVKLSRGVNTLLASGLNTRAIVCLLHESSGVGKPAIRDVLNGLRDLERDFIKRA